MMMVVSAITKFMIYAPLKSKVEFELNFLLLLKNAHGKITRFCNLVNQIGNDPTYSSSEKV